MKDLTDDKVNDMSLVEYLVCLKLIVPAYGHC